MKLIGNLDQNMSCTRDKITTKEVDASVIQGAGKSGLRKPRASDQVSARDNGIGDTKIL